MKSFLREVLSCGKFAVVLDGRVYRNQSFYSVKDGVLTTKAMVKVPLDEVNFFFFHTLNLSKLKKRGRFGKFVPVFFRYNGKRKRITGRVLTESGRWSLVEVAGIPFLTRRF